MLLVSVSTVRDILQLVMMAQVLKTTYGNMILHQIHGCSELILEVLPDAKPLALVLATKDISGRAGADQERTTMIFGNMILLLIAGCKKPTLVEWQEMGLQDSA